MLVSLYCFIKPWKKFLNLYVYLLHEGIVYDFASLIGCNASFWFNKTEFYLTLFMSEIFGVIDFNASHMHVLMLILETAWAITLIILHRVFIDRGSKHSGGRWVKARKNTLCRKGPISCDWSKIRPQLPCIIIHAE